PDLACSVRSEVLLPHAPDGPRQLGIASNPRRGPTRIRLAGLVFVVRRRGDRQLGADRLDPVLLTMGVDERQHHLPRRSSSAWAKNADALRRISLARRSSAFSRSSSLARSRSASAALRRGSALASARCTHERSVWVVQPILPAIDCMAAQREGCSCTCAWNRRTARSRTSGDYWFCFAIAPSSQVMEPPGRPGRFIRSTARARADRPKPGYTAARTQRVRAPECAAHWRAGYTRSRR